MRLLYSTSTDPITDGVICSFFPNVPVLSDRRRIVYIVISTIPTPFNDFITRTGVYTRHVLCWYKYALIENHIILKSIAQEDVPVYLLRGGGRKRV